MPKKSMNITKKKTQIAFAEAMLKLLYEWEYEKITVAQLCDQAGFVRKTFYNNFAYKDDIVYFALEDIFTQIEHRIDLNNMSIIEILKICFSFVIEHKESLLLFYRRGLFHFAHKSITKNITQEHIISKIDKTTVKPEEYKYIAAHMASALMSVIETWIENNFLESVEHMAKLTEYLLNKPKIIE